MSEKKAFPAFILCFLFGVFGLHRFYVGKIFTGILMLLTGGGFGVWVVFDLIMILFENFSDSSGKILKW